MRVWAAKVLWAERTLMLPSVMVGAGASGVSDYIFGIVMLERHKLLDF